MAKHKSSIETKIPISHDLNKMGMLVSDHITAMLAYWDKDQICRFANNAYREWFGKTRQEMIDRMSLKELLGPLYEKNLPYITGALAGKKQVFEREIPLPGGGSRHSLATYYPDISDGTVRGFFVHVADISYIKELEAKLEESRRETLRSVIETQEKERAEIAYTLRDSVSQTLAYCKIVLQENIKKNRTDDFLETIIQLIYQAIKELNTLSVNLTPSNIEHFGFIAATEDYIENLKRSHPVQIHFECADKNIEELDHDDKLCIFRIIQDFLLIFTGNLSTRTIRIRIDYSDYRITMQLSNNDIKFLFPRNQKEYRDILSRVEYYGGTIEELETELEKTLVISLNIR